MTFDKPEPLARVRARKRRAVARQRKAVRAQVVTGCCVACARPATAMHHEPPRSLGGTDSPETCVPLCAWHHADVHCKLLALKRVDGQWIVRRVA